MLGISYKLGTEMITNLKGEFHQINFKKGKIKTLSSARKLKLPWALLRTYWKTRVDKHWWTLLLKMNSCPYIKHQTDCIVWAPQCRLLVRREVYCVSKRSSDPFYLVTYYIKWVTTSWTYSIRSKEQGYIFFISVRRKKSSYSPTNTNKFFP